MVEGVLIVRPMTGADLSRVMENERSASAFPWTERAMVECLEGNYACRVLEQEGEILGHGVTSRTLDEGELLNLCIGRRWQGQGLGGWLLDALVAELREMGGRFLFLEVRASNAPAIGLYRSRGFSVVGCRRGYYPAGAGREDALLMRGDLQHTGREDADAV